MPAYVVMIRERMIDGDEFATYRAKAPSARADRESEAIVAYGTIETLEGPASEGIVILRFPSMEAAKDWYNSPEYQVALVHRLRGAEYRVYITEGVA